MKRESSLDAMGKTGRPLVLAVGFLDGVHIGHQAVLRTAVEHARSAGGRAWALTFDPHPSRVLTPDRAAPMILSTDDRVRRIAEQGLDGCVVLPFTPDLSRLEPDAFLERLVRTASDLREVVVGRNWRYGHGAKGTAEDLPARLNRFGIRATVLPPVMWDGQPVSSTRIRKAIAAGHLDTATALLGRPFQLRGPVEHGREVGRSLGWPTANIRAESDLWPPAGVYAARVNWGGRDLGAAAYIGTRPTFSDGPTHRVLEVHLLDVTAELYDRSLEVDLLEYIRPDRRFDSPAALQEQIARDVESIRSVLQRHGTGGTGAAGPRPA